MPRSPPGLSAATQRRRNAMKSRSVKWPESSQRALYRYRMEKMHAGRSGGIARTNDPLDLQIATQPIEPPIGHGTKMGQTPYPYNIVRCWGRVEILPSTACQRDSSQCAGVPQRNILARFYLQPFGKYLPNVLFPDVTGSGRRVFGALFHNIHFLTVLQQQIL